MEDDLPVTNEAGHGYGCRSIRAIVQQHGGLYIFSPENGIFIMRTALALKENALWEKARRAFFCGKSVPAKYGGKNISAFFRKVAANNATLPPFETTGERRSS